MAAGVAVAAYIPTAVDKVRRARKGPNKVFVGVREAVRMKNSYQGIPHAHIMVIVHIGMYVRVLQVLEIRC